MLTALAEDMNFVPSPLIKGSQLPVTASPGTPMPSSGFYACKCTCLHVDTHMHRIENKNKISLKRKWGGELWLKLVIRIDGRTYGPDAFPNSEFWWRLVVG